MTDLSMLNDDITKLMSEVNSLHIASLTGTSVPLATYTPFAVDEDLKGFWILISELSQHAQNLKASPTCSVMIVRDEQDCKQIYARERVQFEMQAIEISRDKPEWSIGINRLKQRHGKLLSLLEQLADFRLFHLLPQSGRYVIGFGQAYELFRKSLNEIDHQLTGPA